jgi:hypothetical protein
VINLVSRRAAREQAQREFTPSPTVPTIGLGKQPAVSQPVTPPARPVAQCVITLFEIERLFGTDVMRAAISEMTDYPDYRARLRSIRPDGSQDAIRLLRSSKDAEANAVAARWRPPPHSCRSLRRFRA